MEWWQTSGWSDFASMAYRKTPVMGCDDRCNSCWLIHQRDLEYRRSGGWDGGNKKDGKIRGSSSILFVSASRTGDTGPNQWLGCWFLVRAAGSRIGMASGEIRERQFLFQRLSVTIQRFNAILLHNSFIDRDDQDLQPFQTFYFSSVCIFEPLGSLLPRVLKKSTIIINAIIIRTMCALWITGWQPQLVVHVKWFHHISTTDGEVFITGCHDDCVMKL